MNNQESNGSSKKGGLDGDDNPTPVPRHGALSCRPGSGRLVGNPRRDRKLIAIYR